MDQNADSKARLKPDENLIETAHRDAAKEACWEVLSKHVELVMDVRRSHPIQNRELLSTNFVRLSGIPTAIKNQIQQLSTIVQSIILNAADAIETQKQDRSGTSAGDEGLGFHDRQKSDQLIAADNKYRMSCQTLKLTVETFVDLNRRIVSRLEHTAPTLGAVEERNLLLINALLVYELTKFTIEFVQSFRPAGLREIDALRQEVQSGLDALQQEDDRLKGNAEALKVTSVRSATLNRIEARRLMRENTKAEWDEYLSSIRQSEDRITSLRSILTALQVIRDDAASQIAHLGLAAVVRLSRHNLDAIGSTIEEIQDLELVPLDPDRVRKLLHREDEENSPVGKDKLDQTEGGPDKVARAQQRRHS
jgi:hypothetical protein